MVYWPDINDQEPVIVDMSGALLSNSDLAWQQYKNGSCPDCSTEIPMTAVKGEACENCGHVWAWGPNDDPGPDDDRTDEQIVKGKYPDAHLDYEAADGKIEVWANIHGGTSDVIGSGDDEEGAWETARIYVQNED